MTTRRSRHSSTSRTSTYSSRGTKDRIMPRFRPEMASYQTADSAFDTAPMSHFSLSSQVPYGTRNNVTNWLDADTGCFPPDDFHSTAISGQAQASTEDAMLYQSIMMPSTGCNMSGSYEQPISGYSRHAPLGQSTSGSRHVASMCISPDSMQAPPVAMDLNQFSTSFNDIGEAYYNSGILEQHSFPLCGLPPSPPLTHASSGSEDFMFASDFPMDSMISMSSFPQRHGTMTHRPQEITVCEPLGPSQIQAYCGPLPAARPRPLRSASERKVTHQEQGNKQASRSPEDNKPRDDPRYELPPDAEGNYWCPFREESDCPHKEPVKQKCIYAKNLDSHLKPYRCKVQNPDCQEKAFSSNACLFRHEREAHGFHGHGENPHHCIYQGCERAKPGNGFPRKWNLGDHMKRVHGYDMRDEEEPVAVSSDRHNNNAQGRRRKGPKASMSVQMKRSSSSQAKAQAASAFYARDTRPVVNVSRHASQVSYANPIRMSGTHHYQDTYTIPLDSVQYSHMASNPQRHAPKYSGNNFNPVTYAY